jgi:hypothetical protein
MADRPCWVARTRHGCIVAAAVTRDKCRDAARDAGYGPVNVERGTVVTTRLALRWAFECEQCRRLRCG